MATSQLLIGFGIGFWKGWLLALIITVALPLMAGGTGLMANSMQEIQLETQGAYRKAAVMVEEILHGIRTVISFGNEHREISRFGVQVAVARKGMMRTRIVSGVGLGYI